MGNTQGLKHAFFEGKFTDIENAKVSVMTNALQYGNAVFGGIRGYYNAEKGFVSIFRLHDHYKRFLSSLKILGVGFKYSQAELEKITQELMTKNNPSTDVYFRPFAYAGNLDLTPSLYKVDFDFALYMIALGEYLPLDHGVKVKISSFRRISDNAIPSRAKVCGGYINSSLAKKEALDDGYEEAIFLTHEGNVSEGSSMNFFFVKNGVLITPAKTEDVLEGITRASVIELAKAAGIPVEERVVDRTEVYAADEAFFSGTGAQVAWIGSIDGRVMGDGKIGPITQKLQKKFFDIVRGNDDEYAHWCTKINISK